jgi:hypothetical protein
MTSSTTSRSLTSQTREQHGELDFCAPCYHLVGVLYTSGYVVPLQTITVPLQSIIVPLQTTSCHFKLSSSHFKFNRATSNFHLAKLLYIPVLDEAALFECVLSSVDSVSQFLHFPMSVCVQSLTRQASGRDLQIWPKT